MTYKHTKTRNNLKSIRLESVLYDTYLDWCSKCEPEQLETFQEYKEALLAEIETYRK